MMDTQVEKKSRNKRLWVVFLVLLASLFLCVLGAAAAELELSSSFFGPVFGQETVRLSFPNGNNDNMSDANQADGGASAELSADAESETEADASADGSADAGSSSGNGAQAGEEQRCFLGLVCLTAVANADQGNQGDSDIAVDVDDEGIDADADVDADDDEADISASADLPENLEECELIDLNTEDDPEIVAACQAIMINQGIDLDVESN